MQSVVPFVIWVRFPVTGAWDAACLILQGTAMSQMLRSLSPLVSEPERHTKRNGRQCALAVPCTALYQEAFWQWCPPVSLLKIERTYEHTLRWHRALHKRVKPNHIYITSDTHMMALIVLHVRQICICGNTMAAASDLYWCCKGLRLNFCVIVLKASTNRWSSYFNLQVEAFQGIISLFCERKLLRTYLIVVTPDMFSACGDIRNGRVSGIISL